MTFFRFQFCQLAALYVIVASHGLSHCNGVVHVGPWSNDIIYMTPVDCHEHKIYLTCTLKGPATRSSPHSTGVSSRHSSSGLQLVDRTHPTPHRCSKDTYDLSLVTLMHKFDVRHNVQLSPTYIATQPIYLTSPTFAIPPTTYGSTTGIL